MPHARRPATVLVLLAVILGGCTTTEPGWTFAPAPSVTPLPSVDATADPGSPNPTDEGAESPGATDGAAGTVVQVSAVGIAFEQATLDVPADTAFTLEFANNDSGIPHDVDIRDANGTSVFKTDIFNGVETRTYDVPALPAGAYTFVCTVHPAMVIDVTVE